MPIADVPKPKGKKRKAKGEPGEKKKKAKKKKKGKDAAAPTEEIPAEPVRFIITVYHICRSINAMQTYINLI